MQPPLSTSIGLNNNNSAMNSTVNNGNGAAAAPAAAAAANNGHNGGDHSLQTQRTPPPSLEQLRKLQLMRTTLVSLLECKDFDSAVRGCFVRVLLQMHNERSAETSDSYYITPIKGAKRGPSYGGFSCDGATTDWHILIELPPVFRATSNGNVLQLTSISNTAFKTSEYENWIQMARTHNAPLITNAQLEMRLRMLQDVLRNDHISIGSGSGGSRSSKISAAANSALEDEINKHRREVEEAVTRDHHQFPAVDKLSCCSVEQLQEVEQQCLDFMSAIRVAINERSKCCVCHVHVATVVLCPCKHQVVCKECMDKVTVCPAPGCNELVQFKFDVFV